MREAGKQRREKALASLSEAGAASMMQTYQVAAPHIAAQTTAQIALLVAAAGLDYVVGDPWDWPHPVQWMGKVIGLYSQRAIAWQTKQIDNKRRIALTMRLAGIGLAGLLIVGSAIVSGAGLWLLDQISPWLQWGAECVLLAS